MTLNKKYFFAFTLIFLSLKLWSVGLDIVFIPYQGATKKIITENFIILYPEDYSDIAQKIANYCEDVHKKLVPFMNWKPYEKTTVVLSDHTDYPNGLGFPFFRNTMVLYLAPFDLELSLQDIQDPVYSLVVHEYTHVLHLDQIRGGAFFWRVLYGKFYSPNSGSFAWYMEGTAVLAESMNSTNGRLNSVYNDLYIRSDALKNALPNFDEIVGITEGSYQYGARFINYLYTTYGREKYIMFITDISNDFWPFVLQFVFKFKKIYKKPLQVLWNEWRDYETENAKKYYETKKNNIKESKKLTSLGGDINSISRYNEFIYFSNSSTKYDKYIYKYDTKENKLKKIKYGYFNSVSATNNENYILYTKLAGYIGGFYYYDLYSFNQKTKMEKKLTQKKRVSFAGFSTKSDSGVFVTNKAKGVELFKAKFINNDLSDINKINISDDIIFIDQPSVNDDGDMAVFSARNKSGFFRLYILDLTTSELILLNENIIIKNVKWIDDHSVSFVGPDSDHTTNSFYICDLNTMEISKAAETADCIYNGLVIGDKAYFVDSTFTGMHLFETPLSNKTEADLSEMYYNFEKNLQVINPPDKVYETKNYYGMRFLYPGIWGFLPYQLSSGLYYTIGNSLFQVPFMMLAPQFFLLNTTPLGRFTYAITVGFDYMKLYPDNTLSFRLRLPYINIVYEWSNWKGGTKDILDNKIYSSSLTNDFPINFKNELQLYYSYRLWSYNSIGWQTQLVHNFYQYIYFMENGSIYRINYANIMGFFLTASYSYVTQRNRSSRWDGGVISKLTFHFYPRPMLNNFPRYMIKETLEFRIPFKEAFFFTTLNGGFDFLNQNNFKINSDTLRWNDIILNEWDPAFNLIETKAFAFPVRNDLTGSKFIAADLGFDITLYKKKKYWHFLTMGFKELYLRPYAEFVYLYNADNFRDPLRNIMFDTACELITDLFVSYGNIPFTIVFGNAVGYRINDLFPSWNIYLYLSASIM